MYQVAVLQLLHLINTPVHRTVNLQEAQQHIGAHPTNQKRPSKETGEETDACTKLASVGVQQLEIKQPT
jgi:hypothetical protein